MSSDSGLDDPNDQLEDTGAISDAPKGSDDGIDKEEMDDLFGDDDEVDEAAEAKAYDVFQWTLGVSWTNTSSTDGGSLTMKI
jgi:hypothetical protein